MNAGIEEILKSQNYGPEWDAAVAAGRSPEGATGAVLEGTNSYSHGSWENWKNVHYVKCIGSNSENQKGIRAMAMSYNREWSNHYQDPEIVDRCVAWLDYQVRSQGSNGGWNNETYKTWIGGPDRMEANGGINAGARAVGEVYTELADAIEAGGYLDEYIDDDLNPNTPMVADLAYMTGDEELIKKAINASHAMNYFADTIVNSKGFNALRRDYNINTRNYKGPGIVEYAAWNNFIEAGFGSKDSVRSMELKAGRNTLILTDKEIPNTYLINVKNISFEKID